MFVEMRELQRHYYWDTNITGTDILRVIKDILMSEMAIEKLTQSQRLVRGIDY